MPIAQIASTLKVIVYGDIGIYSSIQGFMITGNDKKYIEFSFLPIYEELIDTKQFISSLDEYLNIVANGDEEALNMLKQYVTEITEDEYYKID